MEYDASNGAKTKKTHYHDNGKIETLEEYDPKTGKLKNSKKYTADGNIK